MVRVIIFILYSLTPQGRKTDTERNFFLDFCFQKQNLIVTIFKEVVIPKREHGERKGFPQDKRESSMHTFNRNTETKAREQIW